MTVTPAQRQMLMAKAAEAAARLDWKEVMRLIDQEGFDPNWRVGYDNQSLVHRAASLGQMQALRDLRARGAKLEGVYDRAGREPIHVACRSSRVDVVEWLLDQGCSIETTGAPVKASDKPQPFVEPRLPPLLAAVDRDQIEIVKCLLSRGANVHARNQNGDTALMMAARKNRTGTSMRMIHQLLNYGVEIDAVNNAGRSALMEACFIKKTPNHVDVLVDAGAQIDNPLCKHDFEKWMDARMLFEAGKKFVQARKSIRHIDVSQPFAKADLFALNEHGYAPLDDPKAWEQLPALAKALERAGTPLTRADFFAERAEGSNWVQRAIECRHYADVHRLLDAIGEPMRGRDFADSKDPSQPSALGRAAADAGLGEGALSHYATWEQSDPRRIRVFASELPEELRRQFSNALSLSIRREESLDKGGVGR